MNEASRPCTARARSVRPHCGCPRCLLRLADYERARTRGARWRYTSDDGLAALDRMLARGWSLTAVASATGLPRGTVSTVACGRPVLAPGTAYALCVHGEPTEGTVSAVGVRRRLRALVHAGWRQQDLTGLLGMGQAVVSRHVAGRSATVDVPRWVVVRATYDYLVMRSAGPSWEAVAYARSRGWAPVQAWDGLDIDDPALALPDHPRADEPTPTRRQDAARQARRATDRARWPRRRTSASETPTGPDE